MSEPETAHNPTDTEPVEPVDDEQPDLIITVDPWHDQCGIAGHGSVGLAAKPPTSPTQPAQQNRQRPAPYGLFPAHAAMTHGTGSPARRLLPAYAGMTRICTFASIVVHTVPRTRSDDPLTQVERLTRSSLFPVHAAMTRSLRWSA